MFLGAPAECLPGSTRIFLQAFQEPFFSFEFFFVPNASAFPRPAN